MVILNQCLLWLGQEDFRFLVTDIGYPRKLYHHFFSGRRSNKLIFPGIKNSDLGGYDARQGPMERDCGICRLDCGRKMMNDDNW